MKLIGQSHTKIQVRRTRVKTLKETLVTLFLAVFVAYFIVGLAIMPPALGGSRLLGVWEVALPEPTRIKPTGNYEQEEDRPQSTTQRKLRDRRRS